MTIYTSSKVLPYVYQGVHKETGKIYIGSRTTKLLKLPSHLDILKYKTSSKYVKPIFEEFDWSIIAEFFNPHDAYNFEQELINELWCIDKAKSINIVCNHNKKSFNMTGKTPTADHRNKTSNSLMGKDKTQEHKNNISKSKNGYVASPEHIINNSKAQSGKRLTQEHKNKTSDSMKGKNKTQKHKDNMKLAAILRANSPEGKLNSPNNIRMCCSKCRKETNLTNFSKHIKKCFIL